MGRCGWGLKCFTEVFFLEMANKTMRRGCEEKGGGFVHLELLFYFLGPRSYSIYFPRIFFVRVEFTSHVVSTKCDNGVKPPELYLKRSVQDCS